jgi:uncharacterized protein with ParB-like and HNH nuclease domain
MINPNPSKLEDILNSSIQYVVPKYQREYTWGKNEAIDFLEDLKSYSESSDNLFLGSLIFDISDQKNKKISVVDGQQRITTILLLLIVCRNFAKKINAVQLATLIQNKITFIDPTTAEPLGCRLIASESIKSIFEEISKYEWNGNFNITFPGVDGRKIRWQVGRIKPIYDYFLSELKDFDQNKLSRFLKTIYEAYVVRIDIEDEIEAFSIFERTNARGVDLEASDLLKNYLFAQGVEGLDEIWPQIIENSDGTLLRMLKYFYVSRKGYISKSNLYKEISRYGKNIGAARLVNELFDFSKYYIHIKSADIIGIKNYFDSISCTAISGDQDRYEKIYYSLEGLRLFKISQTYPLIYSAIHCFIESGAVNSASLSKKLIEFFDTLEKYHFINNAVCERIGNEVEKMYADYCDKFYNSKNFDTVVKDLIANLKNHLASEQEFSTRFSEISYSQDTIPLISYIFDRINNSGLHPGQRVRIYNPDQKLLRRNHNIEHFYPQNPSYDLKNGKDVIDAVDNIGNLLVISFRTNSKLGNLSPDKKIDKLKNELLSEVQNQKYVIKFMEDFINENTGWDNKSIINRSKVMAIEAYRKVWKI